MTFNVNKTAGAFELYIEFICISKRYSYVIFSFIVLSRFCSDCAGSIYTLNSKHSIRVNEKAFKEDFFSKVFHPKSEFFSRCWICYDGGSRTLSFIRASLTTLMCVHEMEKMASSSDAKKSWFWGSDIRYKRRCIWSGCVALWIRTTYDTLVYSRCMHVCILRPSYVTVAFEL